MRQHIPIPHDRLLYADCYVKMHTSFLSDRIKRKLRGIYMKLHKADHVRGEITVPGDKSISHRSVMFGSIAKGTTEIHNFLEGADCLSTIGCFRRMGIDIENKNGVVTVHGKGMHGLAAPAETLDCGNSGTTTRLISGILAPQNFDVTLTGDESIRNVR